MGVYYYYYYLIRLYRTLKGCSCRNAVVVCWGRARTVREHGRGDRECVGGGEKERELGGGVSHRVDLKDLTMCTDVQPGPVQGQLGAILLDARFP